jgi:hypothetical protein
VSPSHGGEPLADAAVGSQAIEALVEESKGDLCDVGGVRFGQTARPGNRVNESSVASHEFVPRLFSAFPALLEEAFVFGVG